MQKSVEQEETRTIGGTWYMILDFVVTKEGKGGIINLKSCG